MFVVFRCDCGEWQYQDERCKTRQCPKCGKRIQLKSRRFLGKAGSAMEARVLMINLKLKSL